MSVSRTIAKNTVFGFVETGIDFITGFVLGIILARSLGTEQWGLYAYLTWLLTLTALIVDLGLGEMSKRSIAEALGQGDRRQATGLVRLTLVLRTAAAIIIAIGLVFSFSYWPSLSGNIESKALIIIIAATLLPHGLNYAFMSIFRGFQKYEYASYVIMSTAPLRLILVITLLLTGSGVREVLIVQMGTFCLGAVIGLYFLSRLIRLKDLIIPKLLEGWQRKKALKYALTLAGITFIGYFSFNEFATFFLKIFCTVEDVGFVRLAYRISAVAMIVIPTGFSFVLTPAIAEQFGKGDMGKIKSIYLTSVRYLMMITMPMAIGQIALGAPIVILLYGTEFIPVIILMQIQLLPLAITSISRAASAVIYGMNRPGFVLKISLLWAVINIGMDLWIIPTWGITGFVIYSAISGLILAILIIIFASRKVGVTWPIKDTIKILLASALMGVIVYGVQTQLGIIPSLIVGVPLGLVLYFAFLFLFRIINEEDLSVLDNVRHTLPTPIQKYYVLFHRLMERILLKTKSSYELRIILQEIYEDRARKEEEVIKGNGQKDNNWKIKTPNLTTDDDIQDPEIKLPTPSPTGYREKGIEFIDGNGQKNTSQKIHTTTANSANTIQDPGIKLLTTPQQSSKEPRDDMIKGNGQKNASPKIDAIIPLSTNVIQNPEMQLQTPSRTDSAEQRDNLIKGNGNKDNGHKIHTATLPFTDAIRNPEMQLPTPSRTDSAEQRDNLIKGNGNKDNGHKIHTATLPSTDTVRNPEMQPSTPSQIHSKDHGSVHISEAVKDIHQIRLDAQRELAMTRKMRVDACKYQQQVEARARSEAQQLLLHTRLSSEKEINKFIQKTEQEIRKILADIKVIRATAQGELNAQRKYTDAARIRAMSQEIRDDENNPV